MTMIYQHTQKVPPLLFASGALLTALLSLPKDGAYGLAVVAIVTVVYWVGFSKLTITIGGGNLNYKMGPIKRSIRIDEIERYQIVRNSPLQGWGIRMLQNGLMYNVFGLDAVEFSLKNNSKLRLGTDEPEKLSNALDQAFVKRLL